MGCGGLIGTTESRVRAWAEEKVRDEGGADLG